MVLARCLQRASRIPTRRPLPVATRSTIRTACLLRRSSTRSFSVVSSRQQDLHAFSSQLNDPAAASFLASSPKASPSPQTLTEKIVQRYAVGLPEGKNVHSGDYVTIRPAKCMTHDNTWPVAQVQSSYVVVYKYDCQLTW